MNKLSEILKYVELGAWVITIFITAMFSYQILYTFFGLGSNVNTEQAIVRLYIAAVFFLVPLAIKGARHSIR